MFPVELIFFISKLEFVFYIYLFQIMVCLPLNSFKLKFDYKNNIVYKYILEVLNIKLF